LTQQYSSLEQKLKNNDYKSYYDYLEDLKLFEGFVIDEGPVGPNREAIIYQHMVRFLEEASEVFVNSLLHENEMQGTLKDEMQKSKDAEICDIKEEMLSQKNTYMKKISGLETHTVEMEAKIQIKDQTISNLKNENTTLEK